eukprot:4343741-Prymnesium_polylepis.2
MTRTRSKPKKVPPSTTPTLAPAALYCVQYSEARLCHVMSPSPARLWEHFVILTPSRGQRGPACSTGASGLVPTVVARPIGAMHRRPSLISPSPPPLLLGGGGPHAWARRRRLTRWAASARRPRGRAWGGAACSSRPRSARAACQRCAA